MLAYQYIAITLLYSAISFPTKSSTLDNRLSNGISETYSADRYILDNQSEDKKLIDKNLVKNKIPFTFYAIGNVSINNKNKEVSHDDIIMHMITEQLPEYKINFKYTDYGSAYNKIAASKNSCLRNLMQTTERDNFFYFSRPMNIYLGFQLYFSPLLDPKRLNNIKNLSISEIIKHDKKLTLGVEGDRAYGEKMTNVIKELPSFNKFIRYGSDGENIMIAMLLKGRFDMLIESPLVMDFKVKELAPDVKLKSISPANAKSVMYGRLACSKSPEARKLLDTINNILSDIYPSNAFVDSHLKLMEQPSHKIFKARYKEFIHNNVQ